MSFQRERASDCFSEAKPLLEAHWAEVPDYEGFALDPDWETYAAMDAADCLYTYTLREAGDLKGYALFFVRASLHHRGVLQAVQDILYVSPDVRHLLGARFIRWCDEQLAAEGVTVITRTAKLGHTLGPLLERFGYRKIEEVWSKRLDDEGGS